MRLTIPRYIFLLSSLGLFFLFSLSRCSSEEKNPSKADTPTGYWADSDSLSYVGMMQCRQCHADKHKTYIHTGMGKSFAKSSRQKSAGDYSQHPAVYDSSSNFYYQPFWKKEQLVIAEYRIVDGDTVHRREEEIDWIIGSGQHTNSHLLEKNGYLFQAPITFYTQDGKWDLAPGFEAGHNTRFARMIESECMTCHNGLPEMLSGSLNAYNQIAEGIDCERCHGPGSEHVRQKIAGVKIDTANLIDYSIVNPAKLDLERQIDLCQRCHLQGVAVLNDGADWFDFNPGDRIQEHWQIYLPDFGQGSEQFLMASQAERLRKSDCYIEAGPISCLSCHNPHVSIEQTAAKTFDKSCIDCHSGREQSISSLLCSEEIEVRQTVDDHCSGCHMPASGSVDIPHVSITDHRIQIPGKVESDSEQFRGLICMTDENPTALEMARAYLRFYEGFYGQKEALDSARHYLSLTEGQDDDLSRRAELHLQYLLRNYRAAAKLLEGVDPTMWTDAWACYRAGESLMNIGELSQAENWLKKASELMPAHPDFRFKYANCLAQQQKQSEAMHAYEQVLEMQDWHVEALSNYAFLKILAGNIDQAERHLIEAKNLDPDYLPAQINLIQLYYRTGRESQGGKILNQLKNQHPQDARLEQLSQSLGLS
jgi:Tfp pilus assembly protein PilF